MPLYIHEGRMLYRRNRMVHLEEMSHIFTCPIGECEYVMTARTEDEAVTIRDTHMQSNHPMDLATMRWEEAFEHEVPDYVKRVIHEPI